MFFASLTLHLPNGNRSTSFMLDSGSQFFIVPRSAALSMGLRPHGMTSVMTADGQTPMEFTEISVSHHGEEPVRMQALLGPDNVWICGYLGISHFGLLQQP